MLCLECRKNFSRLTPAMLVAEESLALRSRCNCENLCMFQEPVEYVYNTLLCPQSAVPRIHRSLASDDRYPATRQLANLCTRGCNCAADLPYNLATSLA